MLKMKKIISFILYSFFSFYFSFFSHKKFHKSHNLIAEMDSTVWSVFLYFWMEKLKKIYFYHTTTQDTVKQPQKWNFWTK